MAYSEEFMRTIWDSIPAKVPENWKLDADFRRAKLQRESKDLFEDVMQEIYLEVKLGFQDMLLRPSIKVRQALRMPQPNPFAKPSAAKESRPRSLTLLPTPVSTTPIKSPLLAWPQPTAVNIYSRASDNMQEANSFRSKTSGYCSSNMSVTDLDLIALSECVDEVFESDKSSPTDSCDSGGCCSSSESFCPFDFPTKHSVGGSSLKSYSESVDVESVIDHQEKGSTDSVNSIKGASFSDIVMMSPPVSVSSTPKKCAQSDKDLVDAEIKQKTRGNNTVSTDPRRLYITNIPFRWDETHLTFVLSKIGRVLNAEVIYNDKGSKGFGFVTMGSVQEAQKAICELDKSICEQRVIGVNWAHRKSDVREYRERAMSREQKQALKEQAKRAAKQRAANANGAPAKMVDQPQVQNSNPSAISLFEN